MHECASVTVTVYDVALRPAYVFGGTVLCDIDVIADSVVVTDAALSVSDAVIENGEARSDIDIDVVMYRGRQRIQVLLS